MIMDKRTENLNRIKELVATLNEASKAYYSESREIMPNIEYDKLYDELVDLEKSTKIVLSNSPTVNVGYEVLSNLPKEKHASRMLSLDKTKDVSNLKEWLGEKEGVISWKLDGLTIVLTYDGGKLAKAVTRGNGEIGEVITSNATKFANIPLSIRFKGKLVIRGEAVIKYSDFNKINQEIEDIDAKYKNPRNLCSGSVRQLNNKITAQRNVHFYAFSLVDMFNSDNSEDNIRKTKIKNEESESNNITIEFEKRTEQLDWLKSQGFDVVEYIKVVVGNQNEEGCQSSKPKIYFSMDEAVQYFAEKIIHNDVPSDGLVLMYDDIGYGKSLGTTAKFPRDAIAFKWKDEMRETQLVKIEWSPSRTGLINPVAIFEPVELEGTTVTRASVHNLSIMKELKLGIGDTIEVYKANMIIPQVAGNLTKTGNVVVPETCPVCGKHTIIKKDKDVEVLYCPNERCLAKQIKSFTHFVSRDAMNMEGLSEATIEKLIAVGLIKELADLFHIEEFEETIVDMEGLGKKSFNNLVASVKAARKTTAARFLYSLGISGIGVANAKLISKACCNDWFKIQGLSREELLSISGIGDVMADNYVNFFKDEEKGRIVADLLKEIEIESSTSVVSEQIFEGRTFVITGSLNSFENRDAMKSFIEERGGKVAGSVSSKTDYLINNDNLSGSTKNKKAKELGVPIITEEEFRAIK